MALPSQSGQLALQWEPQRRIFRVSELNAAVQRQLQEQFSNIFVAGEISGCKLATSGHVYFSLKDERSQVRCALFKNASRFVKFKPADGLQVIARGRLEVYEARGEYQFIVETLEPQGAGALQLALEQVKQRLKLEGLFEKERKKPLPFLPQRIGIVTSLTGVVIRDILQVLERRFPGLHIRVHPSQVQGEGAIEQVCAGIRYFSDGKWADVVIVARGGGSFEDLFTFNEEAVARAIAASRIPVISAIGHETDHTIADYVADMRAATPSAAAEIVICTRESLIEQLISAQQRALRSLRYRILDCRQRLEQRAAARAEMLLHRAITVRWQRLDDLDGEMARLLQQNLSSKRRKFDELRRRLEAADLRLRFARNRHAFELIHARLEKAAQTGLRIANRRLEDCQLHLKQLSPLNVLARGYAIVENQERQVLRSAAEAKPDERLRVRLHEGGLEVEVKNVRRNGATE